MSKTWLWIFVAMVVVAGMTYSGCSKGAKKDAGAAPATEQPAAPASEDAGAAPAAEQPAAENEDAAADEPTEYTFAALCDKLVKETKAVNSAAFTADLEKQTKDGCMAGSQAYSASPKATEAIGAFTKVIFDNCKGKSGQDWLQCYGSEGEAAGKAAADAMMN